MERGFVCVNNQIEEALGILQEECAEVIVEVSKIRRFGLNTAHYKSDMQHTHRTMLEVEIGDVLAMVDILIDQGVINTDALEIAKQSKKLKLMQWSKIFA
jgi:NTP pyrophosphatase (non-canonical NTP hydrolase)